MGIDESGKYYLGVFYFNKNDKRAIVPKVNNALGWTINFARPQAYMIIVIIAAAAFLASKIK